MKQQRADSADSIVRRYHGPTEAQMQRCLVHARHVELYHAGDVWSIYPTLEQWCSTMRAHMAYEERDLFPTIVSGGVDRPTIARVERDHSEQLSRLALMLDRAAAWSVRCEHYTRLLDALRSLHALTIEHVRSEEQDLFPLAKQSPR